jgi:Casein kinase II regulatory subunit
MLNQVWVYMLSWYRLTTAHTCSDEDASKIPDVSIVESSAEMLYGLVHQRYILTRVGLQAMVCFTPSVFHCHGDSVWRCSSKSMKMASLDPVRGYIVLAATSYPAGVPTCQALTQSSYIVQIVMTFMCHPAVDFKV